MRKDKFDPGAFKRREALLNFAYGVLEMEAELNAAHRELYRLRDIEQQYNELLNESVAHSQKMMGGVLALCLVPGVGEALSNHATEGGGP